VRLIDPFFVLCLNSVTPPAAFALTLSGGYAIPIPQPEEIGVLESEMDF
jgi:hypothetical protein